MVEMLKKSGKQEWQVMLNVLGALVWTPIFWLVGMGWIIVVGGAELLVAGKKRTLKTASGTEKLDGISVIIPTWNKKELILNCLQLLDLALQALSVPSEIIVIENGSTDGTQEALAQLKLRTPMIVLAQPQNLGFAPAINLAVRHARYNYVYLLNNDMEVQKDTFPPLIQMAKQFLAKGQKFFALTSQVRFFDPQAIRVESGKTYSMPTWGSIHVAHAVNNWSLLKDAVTLYGGGGSSLINKDLFQKLGGFDHDSYRPLYVEDLDLGFNAWRLGWPSYFCATSQIVHHHRQSSVQLRPGPDFFIRKNMLVFIWKNYAGAKLILQHGLGYPLLMCYKYEYQQYFRALIKQLPAIARARIRRAKWRVVYPAQQLLPFVDFAAQHGELAA